MYKAFLIKYGEIGVKGKNSVPDYMHRQWLKEDI